MFEGNIAKEQLITLEVMYFTLCLSLPGSKENPEGVCADSASQALFTHCSPETAVTGHCSRAAEALCRCAGLEEQQCSW